MKQLTRWFVDNQIGTSDPHGCCCPSEPKGTDVVGFSFNMLALLFLAHGMPRARDYTAKYFSLSYYNPNTGRYGLGRADGHLILFFIVLFTGLRAATMEYVLAPFAKSQGMTKRKDITRFSEQAWLFVYYSVFWPLGVVRLASIIDPRPITEHSAYKPSSISLRKPRRPTWTSVSCGRIGPTASSRRS